MATSDKQKEISKRFYWKHRERILSAYDKTKARWIRIKSVYGITQDEWLCLFEKQGRCCAICKTTEVGEKKGWHTDHDHVTGKVRGILCPGCNTTIGRLGDTKEAAQERLITITEYLA
jgi:hypothetical protein